MKAVIHPEGDIHTPYGATEALPVASISATRSAWPDGRTNGPWRAASAWDAAFRASSGK